MVARGGARRRRLDARRQLEHEPCAALARRSGERLELSPERPEGRRRTRQEALPPPGVAVGRAIDPENSRYNWGSFVVALTPRYELRPRSRRALGRTPDEGDLPESHPGTSAVADIIDATSKVVLFTAVSLYAQWEYVPVGAPVDGGERKHEIFSSATSHRILSDLTPLLVWAKRRPHVTPVLLAGDFNATTQIAADNQWDVETEEAKILFQRVRALGLVDLIEHTQATRLRRGICSCNAPDTCSHVRTYRNQNSVDSKPTQLDYAFVSQALLPRVSACTVFDEDRARGLSDHCPLVIDVGDS